MKTNYYPWRRKNMRIYAKLWVKSHNQNHLRLAKWWREVSLRNNPPETPYLPFNTKLTGGG